MDKYTLSEGSLRIIMQGGQVESPIMQILGSKKIATIGSDEERYRILLSDGKHCISFAMFTTQINEKVESGALPMFSIIKIKRYITSVVNNAGKSHKRILVILDLEILASGDKVNKKIGAPEQLPDDEILTKSNGVADQQSKINDHPQSTSKPNLVQSAKPTIQQNIVNMNQTLQEQLTHPISSLSPYQNKWVIKARVSNKSSIRTWSNSRGEGKLFSMDLVDETGEIRATAFRDLVDKFYDYIEVDKIYYISKCQLKMADKRYSILKNDYEMTLTNETVIELCTDDVDGIPQTQYNFISVDKIGHIESGTLVDVIGICKSTSDLQTFQARSTGRELKKKEVTLVDQTDNGIALTLWGLDAEKFDGSSNPVIAIKGAKVGEFGGGKNISTVMSSIMKINPDISEAHRLRGWYDNCGVHKEIMHVPLSANMQWSKSNLATITGVDTANVRLTKDSDFTRLKQIFDDTGSTDPSGGNFQTPWMSFKDIKDHSLGQSERGDYYQVKGTILLIRSENMLYKACPMEECNKKVIDMENGMFRCEKCSREYPNFKYRLIGSVNIGDWSGNQWISMFSSEVEKVLEMTAAEVGQAYEADESAVAEIVNKANFKEFIFKCRAKFETYNDQNRLKTVAVKVDPVDYKEYNSYLISRIKELLE